MNKWNAAAKIAGALTAATVLYNAHDVSIKTSAEHIKHKSSERLTDIYMRSRRMEDLNETTSQLKDFYFRSNADWNLPDKINAITGYFSGAFKQMASDIVPAVLATGALLGKKSSKFFGIGLLIYGIKYLIFDVMDIGRPNHLKGGH